MFEALNTGFNFFIGLGAPAMMFIVITLLSLVFKVSFLNQLKAVSKWPLH